MTMEITPQQARCAALIIWLHGEENKPNWGPNRDDAPLFERIAHKTANGYPISRDDTYAAGHRVIKYSRQLQESPYGKYLTMDYRDAQPAITELVRSMMQLRVAHAELTEALNMVGNYGHW